MTKYLVRYELEVEAEDEADALEAAFYKVSENGTYPEKYTIVKD